MWFTRLVVVLLCVQVALSYYRLKKLSYAQLPNGVSSKGDYLFQGLDRKAAVSAAYDFVNNIVYIVGSTGHLLHVVDIADPANPQWLFSHKFTIGEGIPKSVDVCGNEVAVGLAAQTDINEGHVRFYRTVTKGSGALDVALDGYITVGPHPSNIKYTDDCHILVVPNEGEAGKDVANTYFDPEGTISIIRNEQTGNPFVRLVDFQEYDMGQPKYKPDIRVPSLFVPTKNLPTLTKFSQDVEPEYVAVSSDGTKAWVTLPENNAIAEIDILNGVVTDVNALPNKDWSNAEIDASDRDGGVHRRKYAGLMSLRQPSVIKSLEVGAKTFLFTADEGAKKVYTSAQHGFAWSDVTLGRTISNQIDTSKPTLKTSAANDAFLGRLEVSSIDGKNSFNNMYMQLTAFGGRGFSIWDAADMRTAVYDSEGSLEEYMEAFDKSVFNSDYDSRSATYQSPESFRDTVSDNQGAAVTGLDVKDDNGTIYLIAGTKSTGTLYLYTVDTSSGQPVPTFQSIFRDGVKDLPWNDLYANKTAGDLYISDIGIIPSDHSPTNKPLAYVTSEGAGALAIYEIEKVTTKRRWLK